jgi:hypothetical protein
MPDTLTHHVVRDSTSVGDDGPASNISGPDVT